MTEQITLNRYQQRALAEALDDHGFGDDLVLTQQGDGSVVLGFALATVTIDEDGNREDN